jgi:hypothetical protein
MVGRHAANACERAFLMATGKRPPSSRGYGRPACSHPWCSMARSTERSSPPMSSRSSCRSSEPAKSSLRTTCRAIKGRVFVRPSRPQAANSSSFRPTAPTSTRSRRCSRSSRPYCARLQSEPSMPSGTPSAGSSASSHHRNAQTTLALFGIRGAGLWRIMPSGPRSTRRGGLCRDGGRCARTGRSRDTMAASPARCRGAGATRSAAVTRTPRAC